MGFPGSSAGKNSAGNAEDPSFIPRLWRSSGEGIGYPLKYSCLENPHGQRNLAGYSPWGNKESDMTEQLSMAQHNEIENTPTIKAYLRRTVNIFTIFTSYSSIFSSFLQRQLFFFFFLMKGTIHHLMSGRAMMKRRLALHPSIFPEENHGRVLVFSHLWLPVDYASFLINDQLWINSVGLPVEKWELCPLTLPSCLNVWYLHLVF